MTDPIRVQIRTVMSDRNIRQRALAADLEMSEKHLSQLLTGKVAGSIAIWARIARALDMRLTLTLSERDPRNG